MLFMDVWANISEDIVIGLLITDPSMSLGVSLRPACIRPSLMKNGYPTLINFKYYPPQQPLKTGFLNGLRHYFRFGHSFMERPLWHVYFVFLFPAQPVSTLLPLVTSRLSFFSLMFMETWPFGPDASPFEALIWRSFCPTCKSCL